MLFAFSSSHNVLYVMRRAKNKDVFSLIRDQTMSQTIPRFSAIEGSSIVNVRQVTQFRVTHHVGPDTARGRSSD